MLPEPQAYTLIDTAIQEDLFQEYGVVFVSCVLGVATDQGKRMYSGMVADGTGLGYYRHPWEFPEYHLTHLASGLGLGVCLDEQIMREWIVRIRNYAEWRRPPHKLFATAEAMHELSQKVYGALGDVIVSRAEKQDPGSALAVDHLDKQ
jgi:hypothetical protein